MVSGSKINVVTYKEDIIREMSLEMNISEVELAEIVNLNIKYIKKCVIEKDYLLIGLPNLCRLRFNMWLGMSARREIMDTKIGRARRASIRRKLKMLKEHDNNKMEGVLRNYNTPLFDRLWKKVIRGAPTKNMYGNMYINIKKLEDKTKEILNKIR